MDRSELSNLAFLIRALVANPSVRTIQAARQNMNFGGSEAFRVSIAVLEELTQRVSQQPTAPRNILVDQLFKEAQTLSQTNDQFKKSVGNALTWALESAQSNSVHQR